MNWNAMTTGTADRCPHCGNSSLRLASEQERPSRWTLALAAYRKCETCGHVFEPPARMRLIVGVGLFGFAMLVCSVCSVASLITEKSPSGLLVTSKTLAIVLNVLIAWGGLTTIGSAWGGWRARRAYSEG